MELHYRGAVYESSTKSVEMAEGGLMGRYRGAMLFIRHSKQTPTPHYPCAMKYRGVEIH